MNLRQILFAIRSRYKIALLLFVVTAGAALSVSSGLPVRYTATASVMVDAGPRDALTAMIMPQNLTTQIEIIESDRVSRKVMKHLRLDEDPTVKEGWLVATKGEGTLEDWLIGLLRGSIKVERSSDSNILLISSKGADSNFAAQTANAYAQAYIDTIVEMKVEPAKQYVSWFENQVKVLAGNLERAQTQLSSYQKTHGIVEKDERMDEEAAKLRDLSAQLTVVQGQTSDSRSKQISGDDTLPDVMQNALISGLKTDIARREASLQETALNLGQNHPQYQRMASEISALKRQLEVETRNVARSYSSASSVGQSKEADLRRAIEAQKRKLMTLRSARDGMDVLQRDVTAAAQALDSVNARLNQTALESQVTGANVSMLTPAVAPLAPSSPKPMRVMALLSIALGIFVGLGSAVGIEMLDRRVRSTEDLAEMLQIPVLGVVKRVRLRPRTPLIGVVRPRLR